MKSTFVFALGAALIGLSMGSAQAQAFKGKGHQLKINFSDTRSIKSYWVAGNALSGYPQGTLNTCLKFSPKRGWNDTNYVLRNGSFVKIIAFSSGTCTDGRLFEKGARVPGSDGLTYFWMKAN
jgi:hypothetical protein